ncbi:MAG: FtsX-like permease family protein, partial [Acidobacteria bacterium]|nr:FtsX-like permease family protein [Acidobacteriota bacterium]
PLGRQFQIDSDAERGKPYTIVGVCKDTKDHTENLRAGTRPRFYIALQQESRPVRFVLEVVSSGDSAPVIAEIRAQIKNFDANLPIYSVMTVRQRIERWLSSDIALATLSAFFAGLALLLACIGLYGIMSYTVAGRTREFGVRVALGARREDVLHLVLSEGMLLVGAGLIVGIPLALAGSRLLNSFLFGLKGTDPLSLAGGIALLGIVGLLAAVIPARRATKVDPVVALRYE